jgi:hypothetical protein
MVQDENAASASSLLMPSPDKTGGGSGATATVVSNLTSSQSLLVSHLIPCPQFEVVLLKWMAKSFQPLSLGEDEDFREVCKSLNKRSPILGRDCIYRVLTRGYHLVQQRMIVAFKGVKYAITTDAWTSVAKTGYVTCTCHFIDPATWKLHSMVLGLYEKTGRS